MKKVILFLSIIFLPNLSVLYSQNSIDTNSINVNTKEYHHSIYISFGIKSSSNTSVVITPIGVDTETNLISLIGYNYWFNNEWALNLSAGLFAAESNVGVAGVNSIKIYPVLIGLKYSPSPFKISPTTSVWIAGNIGEYFASGIKTEIRNILFLTASNVEESVIGGNISTGIDIKLGNRFVLTPEVTYHFVNKFKTVIGQRDDFSGLAFLISLGLKL